jgi:hypothetical protein
LTRFELGELSFNYPAAWGKWIEPVHFSGGSSIGVLGTLAPDAHCLEQSPWINCYLTQKLLPGEVAVRIGTFANRDGGPVVDSAATAPPGRTLELRTVSGLPAALSTWRASDSYYSEDENLSLVVMYPSSRTNAYHFEALYRGPGGAELRAQILALFESVRIGPTPTPTLDPATAAAIAGVAIGKLDQYSRGSAADGTVSVYSCFPTEPGTSREGTFDYGPYGPFGAMIAASCAMDIVPDGERFWRLTLEVDWPQQGAIPAGSYVETQWLSPDGEFAGQSFEGALPLPVTP